MRLALRRDRFSLGLGLGLLLRTAKAKRDTGRDAIAVLRGNVDVVQVMGVEEIGRPQLESEMAESPDIKTSSHPRSH
jgi:hypothetical protein